MCGSPGAGAPPGTISPWAKQPWVPIFPSHVLTIHIFFYATHLQTQCSMPNYFTKVSEALYKGLQILLQPNTKNNNKTIETSNKSMVPFCYFYTVVPFFLSVLVKYTFNPTAPIVSPTLSCIYLT